MNKPLVDRIPFAKILIGLVVLFLVSLGMCGLTAVSMAHGGNAHGVGGVAEKMLVFGIVGTVVSIVGVPLTAVIWVVMTVVSRSMHKEPEPDKDSDNRGKGGDAND